MVSFAAFSLALHGATPPFGSVATPSTDAHTTIWSVPVVAAPGDEPRRHQALRYCSAPVPPSCRRSVFQTAVTKRSGTAPARCATGMPTRRSQVAGYANVELRDSWSPPLPAFGPTTDGLAWTVRSLIATPAGSIGGNAVLPAFTANGRRGICTGAGHRDVSRHAGQMSPWRAPQHRCVATAETRFLRWRSKLTTTPPSGTLAASTTEAEISTSGGRAQRGRWRGRQRECRTGDRNAGLSRSQRR